MYVVVWTTDERVCVYVYTRAYACIASRSHPRLFFLSFFLCPQYVHVSTPMINHIVLYTQYKLAIISDGGSGDVSRRTEE